MESSLIEVTRRLPFHGSAERVAGTWIPQDCQYLELHFHEPLNYRPFKSVTN